jgi:hypothetical protein
MQGQNPGFRLHLQGCPLAGVNESRRRALSPTEEPWCGVSGERLAVGRPCDTSVTADGDAAVDAVDK